MANIPYETQVKLKVSFVDDIMPRMAAIVKPGDTLVVTLNRRISMADGRHMSDMWREITKGTSNIAFVDDVAEITVLRPTDEDEDEPFRVVQARGGVEE
jgi:hypothetical protein